MSRGRMMVMTPPRGFMRDTQDTRHMHHLRELGGGVPGGDGVTPPG